MDPTTDPTMTDPTMTDPTMTDPTMTDPTMDTTMSLDGSDPTMDTGVDGNSSGTSAEELHPHQVTNYAAMTFQDDVQYQRFISDGWLQVVINSCNLATLFDGNMFMTPKDLLARAAVQMQLNHTLNMAES